MDVRTSCAVVLCVLSKGGHPVDREVLEPRKRHEKTRCHFEVTPGLPTFGSLVRPSATSDGDAQKTGGYGAHSRLLTRCNSRIQSFVGYSAFGTT